ncbi:PDZ domain-containing protein [Agromyces protaetiae]|uniref:PDZ domain-containing protein n=1 Tax=Agromyces protaetiae TaxID=2509455 RepID=A0A4P6F9P2_9MICO|nr:trypsin-like peptidase domain-containing protein [Agromyces protaetiae]QAY72325.1 PDZ domain-containing protein [Agromyces protaetiae]
MNSTTRPPRLARTALAATAVGAVAALSGCAGLPGIPGSDPGRAPGAVGFDGVQSATIQIEAVGTFVSPESGGYEAAGRGSGFLISPDGLAVTNNHVVVGAGTLDVWVGGDTRKTLNAEVLGSSECLDLAVIRLDAEDLPFFEWHEGEIATATDVYAAGFPLGDPTFTMTRGIVSKASTRGETPWASIDEVIEHDARIRGGNSGGPLVDAEGRLVGVNYAGNNTYDTNLAIHRDEVLAVVGDLIEGHDVLSLGINAQAITDEEGNGLGVWVSSVASGSAADEAGILPGDLVTRMQGVTLATDGTLADYCDVLRTHGQDSTIDVHVYRPSDGLYYRGQFNGDELAPVQVVESAPGGAAAGGAAAGEFVQVTDDSGAISVEVPASWDDLDGAGYTNEFGTWASIVATPDMAAFSDTWNAPGTWIAASEDAVGARSVDALVADAAVFLTQHCTLAGADVFDDGLHEGKYEVYEGCGEPGASYIFLAANAKNGSYVITVAVQANAEEDLAAIDRVIGSFSAKF